MPSTKKRASRILILDDDPDLVEAIAGVLVEEGYDVHRSATRSVPEVVALAPDLVMIDCPPGAKGEVLKFLQQLRLRRETAKIPVLLGVTSTRLLEPNLLRERRIDVLVRPFALEELTAAVSNLLDVARPAAGVS